MMSPVLYLWVENGTGGSVTITTSSWVYIVT